MGFGVLWVASQGLKSKRFKPQKCCLRGLLPRLKRNKYNKVVVGACLVWLIKHMTSTRGWITSCIGGVGMLGRSRTSLSRASSWILQRIPSLKLNSRIFASSAFSSARAYLCPYPSLPRVRTRARDVFQHFLKNFYAMTTVAFAFRGDRQAATLTLPIKVSL